MHTHSQSLGKLPKLAVNLENKDKKEERDGGRAPDPQPNRKASESMYFLQKLQFHKLFHLSCIIIDYFLCLPHTQSTASSHSPPSSPTARERASNLLKSLASPLNPTKRSLPPNEKSFHHSDLVINRSSARSTKEAAAQVRRSKSFNDPAMRAMSMAGSSGSLVYHPLDLAITGAPPLRTRALSAGLCICFDCKGEVYYTSISAIAILMLATYQGHKGVFSTLT